jgi:hypothetical protein
LRKKAKTRKSFSWVKKSNIGLKKSLGCSGVENTTAHNYTLLYETNFATKILGLFVSHP